MSDNKILPGGGAVECIKATPLVDLLRGVPKDGRVMYQWDAGSHQNIPYGPMCHEAANRIEFLEALLSGDNALQTGLKEEIEHLKDLLGKANALCRIRAERIKELEAERDAAHNTLHQSFEAAKQERALLVAELDKLRAEHDAANAALFQMQQEPVAEIEMGKMGGSAVDLAKLLELPIGTKLYTAPTILESWQPIETAPKTGRTILLGYFNSHGYWRTMRGKWFSQEQIEAEWEEPEDCDGLEGWYETSVEADDIPNCWATEPTHWMPLPKPPEVKP